ncbi:MAG: DUF4840 domain-containing protein [Prevotella sp.]|nr:DUF4840 domain-containing protein [Prevotella sp.]
MKTIKLHSAMLLGMFAAATFTSCVDGDDDGLTATILETDEQKANALSAMAGMYNGTLYYYDSTAAQNTGSTAFMWTINSNGTFQANNFPVSILANYTSDVQTKAILSQAGFKKITGKVEPYAAFSSYYQASFLPDNTENEWTVTLENGEEPTTHTVSLSLTQSYTYNSTSVYSTFAFETTNRTLQGTILLDKMTIDGTLYDLKSNIAISGIR